MGMEAVFQIIISTTATIGVGLLAWLCISVNNLNIKIAVVIEQLRQHDHRISKLEGENHG